MIYVIAFFFLSFLNAWKDIFIKKTVKHVDANVLAGIVSLVSALLLVPPLFHTGIPVLAPGFWWVFIFGAILYYGGKFFAFNALKHGEISYITPLKGLVTANAALTSFILLGEVPSFSGAIGLILILVGVYVLSFKKENAHWYTPFTQIFHNKGSQMYLISIACYGFTVTIDKMGVLASSPIFWVILMNLSVFFLSIGQMKGKTKATLERLSDMKIALVTIVILYTSVIVAQMYVISEILSSYTSAMRASSAIFSVIIGGWYFREQDLLQKSLATCIILLGVIFISLWG